MDTLIENEIPCLIEDPFENDDEGKMETNVDQDQDEQKTDKNEIQDKEKRENEAFEENEYQKDGFLDDTFNDSDTDCDSKTDNDNDKNFLDHTEFNGNKDEEFTNAKDVIQNKEDETFEEDERFEEDETLEENESQKDEFPDFSTGTVSTDKNAQYEGHKIEFIDDFDQDPIIPTRQKKKDFHPDEEDVLFELKDITIERDELFENEAFGTKRKEVAVYLHGNLERGETVCVKCTGYRPFFYLTIPEHSSKDKDQKWVNDFLKDIKKQPHKKPKFFDKSDHYGLPFNELESAELTYKLPTTGFRNLQPIPCILFRFYTLNAYYRFKNELEKLYPAPTQEEIQHGVYKNDIMLSEEKIPHDIKFCNYYSIPFCGWVKLSAGTYERWNGISKKRVMHNFITSSLEGLNNKDELADSTINSFDIEAIRHDGTEAMPDPTNPLDFTACIGHAVESTSRTFPRMYYIFTWGGPVKIPETDRKGRPLTKRKVILKNYKDEASMLTHWVRWIRSTKISFDCTIGWHIYGFDLGFLATRIRILPGIEPDIKEWGRLEGYESKIKESNIESKAIAFNKYQLTPSPGEIFVDSLIIFQRDVTLRLPDYQLKTVGKHFLGEEKDDVHYSEIKSLFFGKDTDRGLLIAYNLQDCDLVLNLFFKCAHWAKMSNVCRVNRVPMNMLCPRGQQIRVFGGFHKNAMDDGYIIYRPHYHPILDEPIVEDPSLWTDEGNKEREKLEKKFENKSDIDALIDYWNKQLNISKFKPVMSMIKVDENGTAFEKIIHENTKPIGMIPVSEIVTNVKLYGKDVNPFKIDDGEQKSKQGNTGFFARNGKSIEEIEKLSRVRRKRKFVLTDSGTMKPIPIISKNASRKKTTEEDNMNRQEESEKGFAGGFVMEPKPGFYENIPILDFNALYPNIMMSYCLDPSLLVLDQRFANCPGVTYLRIRFNKDKEFLFAQGFPGVMIKHTRNLVNSRKVAQGIQAMFETRVDYCRKQIVRLLALAEDTKADDVIKKVTEFVSKNESNGFNYDKGIEIFNCFLKAEIDVTKSVLIGNGILAEYTDKTKKEKVVYSDEFVVTESLKHLDSKNEKLKQSLAFCVKIKNNYEEKIESWKECENTSSDIVSVVSLILQTLLSYEADATNYNSKQNELKVGSNSTFGFLGAGGKVQFSSLDGRIIHKAMMQVMPVSACVTYIGRKTIESAKEWVEKTYVGTKVIYADTDSLFILFHESIIPKGVEGLIKTFDVAEQAAIGISQLFTFPGSSMKIVHEKSAKFLIMYSAKCYALDKYVKKPYDEKGEIQDPGKLEIKGLTFSKRDCCKFVSALCKSALDKILKQGKLEEAKQDVMERLLDLIEDRMRGDEIKLAKQKMTELLEHMVKPEEFKKLKECIPKLICSPVEYIDDIAKNLTDQMKELLEPSVIKSLREKLNTVIQDKIKLDKLKIYKKLSKKTYNPKTEANKDEVHDSDKLMSFIVKTKERKTEEKVNDQLPAGIAAHAQLAYKINQRKPGLGPKSGESVQYVFIDMGLDAKEKYNLKSLKKKFVKCGEGWIDDYEYVLENKIKVDKLWYLQNQCLKNISKLFEPLMRDPGSLLDESISLQTRKQFGMKKGSDITQQLNRFGLIKKQKTEQRVFPEQELEIL